MTINQGKIITNGKKILNNLFLVLLKTTLSIYYIF